jgi:hypothetical protein
LDLAGEALALAVVIAGAWILSHSCLILGEDEKSPVRCLPPGYQAQASGEWNGQDADVSARQAASGPAGL